MRGPWIASLRFARNDGVEIGSLISGGRLGRSRVSIQVDWSWRPRNSYKRRQRRLSRGLSDQSRGLDRDFTLLSEEDREDRPEGHKVGASAL